LGNRHKTKKKRAFYLQMHTVQFMSTRKWTIEILPSGVGEAELENDWNLTQGCRRLYLSFDLRILITSLVSANSSSENERKIRIIKLAKQFANAIEREHLI
jgi:hypothetical protein